MVRWKQLFTGNKDRHHLRDEARSRESIPSRPLLQLASANLIPSSPLEPQRPDRIRNRPGRRYESGASPEVPNRASRLVRDGRVQNYKSQQPRHHAQGHKNSQRSRWGGAWGVRGVLPAGVLSLVQEAGHARVVGCGFTQCESRCL